MPHRLDLTLTWISRVVAAAALAVVTWVCATAWGAVVHGHPAFAIWLGLTVAAALTALLWSLRPREHRHGWRRGLRIVGLVAATAWVGGTAWLRPFPAVEPALSAMEPDAGVTVTETATRIVMEPTGGGAETGVLFQPGALVEARAYAAHLRPLAEAGHPVVIAKQPLGIAFLAPGALDAARGAGLGVTQWVVGGHSLGGVVAAMQAAGDRADSAAPVTGLLLFGSYPATDISGFDGSVRSIFGSEDGLSTPEEVEASRENLPADWTSLILVDGGSHAQFGSYGPQPGDGEPTISDAQARRQITEAALAFLDMLDG